MKSKRRALASHFALDLFVAVLALLGLLIVLSWILQQDGSNRFVHATIGEVASELFCALAGDTDWAPGPPSTSVYVLISSTLYLAIKGFVIGVGLAILGGLIVGLRPASARRAITALNSLRAIPLTLMTAVLAVLPAWGHVAPWFDADAPDKDPSILIALGCFLYISVGIADGISQRSAEREQLFRQVLGLSRGQYLRLVLSREAMPSLITASRVALLFALVLAIVFEQLLNYPGAGRQVWRWMNDAGTARSSPYPEAQALALLLLVAALGILLDLAFVALRGLALRWQRGRVT